MPTSTELPHPEADPEVLAALDLKPERNKWGRRAVRLLIAVLLLGGAAFGWTRLQKSRAEAQKPVYETVAVERRKLEVTINATGTVNGLSTVEVGAEVSGKIVSVSVDYNDPVKIGQVIAVIDPEQSKASLDEASAQVAAADATIHQAEATLIEANQLAQRARAQVKEGILSVQELETAEANAARAKASLASSKASATLARASLKLARSRLEKTTIHSPIDGIVLSRLVEPGQTVTAGFQTPILFKLTEDLRRMNLSVLIDEADIGRAREGQSATFTVEAYPGQVFQSKVLSLRNEPQKDQNVVSYEAILSVDNDALLLRPGMTATATIVTSVEENVLSVPNSALRFTPPSPEPARGGPPGSRASQRPDALGHQIWRLDGDTPVAIQVEPGASDGQFTELKSDALREGDRVVVDVKTAR